MEMSRHLPFMGDTEQGQGALPPATAGRCAELMPQAHLSSPQAPCEAGGEVGHPCADEGTVGLKGDGGAHGRRPLPAARVPPECPRPRHSGHR